MRCAAPHPFQRPRYAAAREPRNLRRVVRAPDFMRGGVCPAGTPCCGRRLARRRSAGTQPATSIAGMLPDPHPSIFA